MVNLLSWLKRKKKVNVKQKKRRLQKAAVGQHVDSSNRQVGDALGDIYKQLNEMTILLSNHDHFLRDDHHQRGLVRLAKLLSENFYNLSSQQQKQIKQNIEFIQTDKYILSALANSRRLRVVEILGELKNKGIRNRQYISERVNRLVEAGILERARVGKQVFYSKINNKPMIADMSGDHYNGS